MRPDLDEKISKAYDLLASRNVAPKSRSDWGIRFHDDTALSGSPGSFAWFSSFKEITEFVSNCLCFYNAGGSDASPQMLAKKLEILSRLTLEKKVDLESYRKRFNTELRGMCHIEWMGTLEELMRGDGEYSIRIREEYRSAMDEEDSSEKISDNEQPSFVSFLEQYDF